MTFPKYRLKKKKSAKEIFHTPCRNQRGRQNQLRGQNPHPGGTEKEKRPLGDIELIDFVFQEAKGCSQAVHRSEKCKTFE